MPTTLTPAQLARDLELRDLSDPRAGPHAMQQLVDLAVGALAARWGCEVRIERGPRVVPLADNYDRLRYPPAAVTRDARYTRYVDQDHVLRSHATAMVPPALIGWPPTPPTTSCSSALASPIAVTPSTAFTPGPHTSSTSGGSPATRSAKGELREMIRVLVDALVPGREWRTEPRLHPYTLHGRQADVAAGTEWIEVGECGLAHPEVLAGAGLEGWSGLALGMGLDRLLMLRKGVPDIRLLRSADPRVAGQMDDLEPYRAVSDLPAVTRDLSVAVPADADADQLGDRVREALGDRADLLETATIVSETSHADLPGPARERLGMDETQKNVLVRIVMRPLDRTLTDAEANHLRDRIYEAVHHGTTGQWTAG